VGVFEEIPIVVLHVIFGQDPKLDECSKPAEFYSKPIVAEDSRGPFHRVTRECVWMAFEKKWILEAG